MSQHHREVWLRPGHGSKELDSGLLPRKVGEKTECPLFSLCRTLGPCHLLSISRAQPWEGAHQGEWHGYQPPHFTSRRSVLSRPTESGADKRGWPVLPAGGGGLRGLWGQQPAAEESGLSLRSEKRPFGAAAHLTGRFPGTRRVTWASLGVGKKNIIPQQSVEFLGIFLLSSPTFPT